MSVDTSRMTDPFQDLEDYNGTPPTHATIREIDVEIVDNELSFFFSRANYEIDIEKYPNKFVGLLTDVRTGKVPWPDSDGIKPQPPISPLSLKNGVFCYVIYRLADRKNWQFSRTHAPFSIGKEGHGKECHFHARRIDDQGNIDKVENEEPKKDKCKVACFISDGRKASGYTGLYEHALNLHVDLVYGGTEKARIPLIIDPDVRFPGGSGVDGG